MKTDRYILVILAIIVAICTLANMLRKRNMVSKKSEMAYGMKSIYLAGGCFWGVEKYFDQFDGVVFTEVGYANGPEGEPTYKEVCNSSGHAETVHVGYDESRISLSKLLEYYFMIIDPLSVNKQGNDTGIQYRTGIYYTDENQLNKIMEVYNREEKSVGMQLAVEVEPLNNFYKAEEYHQKYLVKNPVS